MKQLLPTKSPIIIAHRGAQSIYPEHTMEAYKKAVVMGADYIEIDVVLTKDKVLVARHEPFLSPTTNIHEFTEFKGRKTTRQLDGIAVNDWFISDFTLAELKKIRTLQRWENRSHEFDNTFEIAAFEEIVDFVISYNKEFNVEVGIYVELKHPTFHRDLGLQIEDIFLEKLSKHRLNNRNSKIYIQCFEPFTLQYLRQRTTVKLIQLLGASGINTNGTLRFKNSDGTYDPEGQPYDFYSASDTRDYEYLATKDGLEFISTYADGVGPWKPFIVVLKEGDHNDPKPRITDFVTLAHQSGLVVHPYTFRDEDKGWYHSGVPRDEYFLFFEAGVDGVFTDYTDEAVRARNEFLTLKTTS